MFGTIFYFRRVVPSLPIQAQEEICNSSLPSASDRNSIPLSFAPYRGNIENCSPKSL